MLYCIIYIYIYNMQWIGYVREIYAQGTKHLPPTRPGPREGADYKCVQEKTETETSPSNGARGGSGQASKVKRQDDESKAARDLSVSRSVIWNYIYIYIYIYNMQ